MVEQPKPASDAPFGLQPNIAMGLAYLLMWLGGLIMLIGGGTNKAVKFAAAQSITLWVAWWIVDVAVFWFILPMMHLWLISFPLSMLWSVLALIVWLWTFISGFQGKEVRVPIVDGLTENIFKSAL
jgi:uncharacterized membrane protein